MQCLGQGPAWARVQEVMLGAVEWETGVIHCLVNCSAFKFASCLCQELYEDLVDGIWIDEASDARWTENKLV